MPKIADVITTQNYQNLQSALQWEPADGVDTTFEANQNVSFDLARSNTDLQKGKWYGIKVWLYNFVIGIATPGSDPDDPQLVGLCKCPRPTLVQAPEFTDLPQGQKKQHEQTFGAFHPLSGDTPVRFGVFCNAFENDTTKAWDKIVDALSGDLKNAVTLGLNALPMLSQYQTPQVAGSALTDLVRQGLTPTPDLVSGDDIICDTVNAVNWFRKVDKQSWLARKWHIFTTDNTAAWYLTQWFIELSTVIGVYDYAGLVPTSHYNALYASLNENVSLVNSDLAALYVMKGLNKKKVAASLAISEDDISFAVNSLSKAPKEEFNSRVQAAMVHSLDKKMV